MGDGTELVGTPLEVAELMWLRAFGYPGEQSGDVAAFCVWVLERYGLSMPSELKGEQAAEAMLAALVAGGYAAVVVAKVLPFAKVAKR